MSYKTRKKALLLLADGTKFFGKAVASEGTRFGEICFNTGMTGYQEIFTDPSYFGQLMVTTNAHIGNYGVHADDAQSDCIKISGLICKNFSYEYSRPLADLSLEAYLEENNLFAISDVDTRALVNYIRENGAMNAVITTELDREEALQRELAELPSMEGLELASKVSTKAPIFLVIPMLSLRLPPSTWVSKPTYSNTCPTGGFTSKFFLMTLLLIKCWNGARTASLFQMAPVILTHFTVFKR